MRNAPQCGMVCRMTSSTVIPPLVGQSQAANLIGISRTTVARWIEQGILRPATTVNGAPVFTADDIEQLAAAHRLLAGER